MFKKTLVVLFVLSLALSGICFIPMVEAHDGHNHHTVIVTVYRAGAHGRVPAFDVPVRICRWVWWNPVHSSIWKEKNTNQNGVAIFRYAGNADSIYRVLLREMPNMAVFTSELHGGVDTSANVTLYGG